MLAKTCASCIKSYTDIQRTFFLREPGRHRGTHPMYCDIFSKKCTNHDIKGVALKLFTYKPFTWCIVGRGKISFAFSKLKFKIIGLLKQIKVSLLFRSGLNLRIRILSDIFNEVSSVMWHILKLIIFISWPALRAWLRILLLEWVVKGWTVLMEIPLWSAVRASRWREGSPIYVEEHCPRLNL